MYDTFKDGVNSLSWLVFRTDFSSFLDSALTSVPLVLSI